MKRILPPILLASASLAGAPAAPGGWERLASLPVGNGGFVVGSVAGQIVVAGGTTWQGETKLWLDHIWTYDPSHDAWREAGRLPVAVAYPASGYDGRALWFAGGSGGGGAHRTLWRLESAGPAVRATPVARAAVYAVGGVIGGKLYAVGGTDDQAGIARTTNHLVATNLATGAVERLADHPEQMVSNAGAAVLGQRLFVFGGGYWDAARQGVFNHASAHAFSVASGRWERLPPLPHPGRGFSALALDDRRILVAGGYRNDAVEFVADAYLFDSATGAYVPTTALPYAGMVGLVPDGEWLYCLGGEDRKRHRTAAAYRIRWAELLPRG
jgi:N-acetylneuraminic acid mutarotase